MECLLQNLLKNYNSYYYRFILSPFLSQIAGLITKMIEFSNIMSDMSKPFFTLQLHICSNF